MTEPVRFRVLGPLLAGTAAGETRLAGAKERTVLSMLLLHPNQAVPVARLVEAVWGEQPPETARNQIQQSISRLRRRLATAGEPGPVIRTDPVGYRLVVDPAELDLLEFRRLLAEARAAAAAGPSTAARDRYRAALALWRGAAFSGVESAPVHRAAAAIEEEKVAALTECVQLELALGKAHELVGELAEAVLQHPYRESLHAALMLALYRSGRQADALAAYQRVRKLLSEELGTEPGPELRQLHDALLNHGPGLSAPEPARPPAAPATGPRPRELPADVAAFTGREAALATLDGALPDALAGGPVVISAIAGTAGVGKTALAIHWSHRIADRLPDGQLFLDLRGHATGPALRPIEALAALLRSLGVPPEQIPADQAQAATLYRSTLAGRRMLVVLDNAGAVDQVRPLLPGSPGCLVLITSRDRLSGLVTRDGARRLTLDVLTTTEAHRLLSQLLGADRVQAEPDAVARLATACAHLPLALRIAGANLADQPGTAVASYVDQLTSGDRVAVLRVDDDDESSVLSALDLSYRTLPAGTARLFRLLGLVPGPDFTAATAAALTATSIEDATAELRRLAAGHLVREHAPGRYTFHDLLRLHASRLAGAIDGDDQCQTATQRLLGHYLDLTDAAASLLYPQVVRLPVRSGDRPPPAVQLPGPEQALAWLDDERENLFAAVRHATDHGPRRLGWLLADSLRDYLMRRQLTVEWRAVAEAALAAARLAGDHQAQAAALLSVAKLDARTGRYPEATEGYRTALELARRAGWTPGEAVLLRGLGIVYNARGRLDSAADSFAEALSLDQRTGSLDGQAGSLTNLGIINRERGRLHDAADHYARALAIDRQLGSTDGEAASLTNLGTVHHDLGMLDRAIGELSRALELHRQAGDRPGTAVNHTGLANVLRDAGRLEEALEHANSSMALVSEMDMDRLLTDTLNALGAVLHALGEPDQARRQHLRALALAGRLGARYPETTAHLGLAGAGLGLGEDDQAAAHARQALDTAGTVGYRVLEGQALTRLAEIRLAQGRYAEADQQARSALECHRQTGHRLGEARTLVTLSRLRQAAGEPDPARRYRQAATDLFTDLGAPVPPDPAAAGAR